MEGPASKKHTEAETTFVSPLHGLVRSPTTARHDLKAYMGVYQKKGPLI